MDVTYQEDAEEEQIRRDLDALRAVITICVRNVLKFKWRKAHSMSINLLNFKALTDGAVMAKRLPKDAKGIVMQWNQGMCKDSDVLGDVIMIYAFTV